MLPKATALTPRLLLALAAALALAGCQQKMAVQPYYKPLQENPLFADGAASRPLVPNTIARGNMRDDSVFFTGKENGADTKTFPLAVTKEVLDRGMERFNVYCSPCHSALGDGNGMIVQRGLSAPPSFHEERLVKSDPGHYYDVISNGWGRMNSYEHITVRDRWCIVAYVKALQLSQNQPIDSVPADVRKQLTDLTTGSLKTYTDAGTVGYVPLGLANPAPVYPSHGEHADGHAHGSTSHNESHGKTGAPGALNNPKTEASQEHSAGTKGSH